MAHLPKKWIVVFSHQAYPTFGNVEPDIVHLNINDQVFDWEQRHFPSFNVHIRMTLQSVKSMRQETGKDYR
jgi:hypothetical protein